MLWNVGVWRRLRPACFLVFAGLALILLNGCQTAPPSGDRPFAFGKDTFSFENNLTWEYFYDSEGRWTSQKRQPKPHYTLHCFTVARAAKEFFLQARFDPSQPRVALAQYTNLVKRVIATNPRRALPEADKIVLPGYSNLFEFSSDHQDMLKALCGKAYTSYFQRGHWRMVLPFTGRQREKTAVQLKRSVENLCPAVVHVLTFPSLKINHAMLVFDAEETAEGTRFLCYDPNDSKHPGALLYDASRHRFSMKPNSYFPGGEVQAYQVFYAWNY